MSEHESHPPSGATAALPGEALGDRPGPTSVLMKVLSAVLSGGLLVLLFLVIVPALGSLNGVWDRDHLDVARSPSRCCCWPPSSSGCCWPRRTRR